MTEGTGDRCLIASQNILSYEPSNEHVRMSKSPALEKAPTSNPSSGLTGGKMILLAILLAGTLLRLWYINWSLPDLYEEATPLVKSWKMWNWGGSGFAFNPHFFNYPALTFYLNFLLQSLQFVTGFLLGIYRNLAAYGAEMTSIVIPARPHALTNIPVAASVREPWRSA